MGDSSSSCSHPDPVEIGLEAVEVMAVLLDAGRPETSLFHQVVEEAGDSGGERALGGDAGPSG